MAITPLPKRSKKRILYTHLQPNQHATYAPYAHRAIFRMPEMMREPQSVYCFSHLPIVAWYYWEAYLLHHDAFGWKTLTKPDDLNLLEYNPFEYWWPPTLTVTENFAMQVYEFIRPAPKHPGIKVGWSWTLVHATKGHPTNQLRLHWQHENKIVQLTSNRSLPNPQLMKQG